MGTKINTTTRMHAQGTQVIISNERGEVVLEFRIGDELKPDTNMARLVLVKMHWKGLLAPALAGTTIPADLVAGLSGEGIDIAVPLVIQGAQIAVSAGTLHFDDVLFAYLNVLSWYSYHHLRGAKPLSYGEYHTKSFKVIRPVFNWTCPACTKEFDNPDELVHTESIAIAYLKWMVVHFAKYHGWGTGTHKPGKSQYEMVKKSTKKEVPISK